MAAVFTLKDSFSDASIDTVTRWTNNYTSTATLSEAAGLAVITLAVTTAGSNYAGFLSGTYDLTGSQMFIKVDTVPLQTTHAQMYFKAEIDVNNAVEFLIEFGSLAARKMVAGVTTSLASATYNGTTHKWWKIRENNGTTYWETSTDGVDWTVFHSVANPITMTSLKVNLGAGTYQSETAPGTGKWDNFNLLPVDKDGIQAYVGSYAARTTTGLKEIQDFDFLPKLVLYVATSLTADGNGADAYLSVGVAAGSGAQHVVAVTSTNNQDTSDSERNRDEAFAGMIINTSGTALWKTALSSFEANGFTQNESTVDATARKVLYLALGGTFIGTAGRGKMNPSAGTGSKSLTGLPAQPKAMGFTSVNTTAYPQANYNFGMGLMTGPGDEGSIAMSDQDAQGTSNNRKQQQGNKWLTLLSSTANTNQGAATITGLTSDGFTYDVTVATTNDLFYWYFTGVARTKVTRFQFGTATGDLAIKNIGFKPVAAIFISAQEVTGGTITDGARITIGMASGPSNRGCIWQGMADNAAFSNVSTNMDTTKVIKFLTENGATPTVVAAADLKQFTDDGCILDITTADATDREVVVMFIGEPRPSRGTTNYQNPGMYI